MKILLVTRGSQGDVLPYLAVARELVKRGHEVTVNIPHVFEEMAKKTVLKKALKYAPLKSDFARQAASDGTVKTEINEDMFSVPYEPISIDAVEIDTETGEIIPNEEENDA